MWKLLGGDVAALSRLSFSKSTEQYLPSAFNVTGFAAASVGIANLAAAELKAARRNQLAQGKVEVNCLEACAAFKSEVLLKPKEWQIGALWDPLSGDYKAANGWIRLPGIGISVSAAARCAC